MRANFTLPSSMLFFIFVNSMQEIKRRSLSHDESFIDSNISRAKYHEDVIIFRAAKYGKPSYIDMELNGINTRQLELIQKNMFLLRVYNL